MGGGVGSRDGLAPNRCVETFVGWREEWQAPPYLEGTITKQRRTCATL